MCTVAADTSHFHLLRGTRTLPLELTEELHGTCTLVLNRQRSSSRACWPTKLTTEGLESVSERPTVLGLVR